MRSKFFLIAFSLLAQLSLGQKARISGMIADTTGQPLPFVNIYFPQLQRGTVSDSSGKFKIDQVPFGSQRILISSVGFHPYDETIVIKAPLLKLNVQLRQVYSELTTINITDQKDNNTAFHRLKNIEGVAIYAAKKSEVIELKNVTANLSSNNARQVFSRVPGVNVWESDCAGLQLGVGARGLSPDRSANFNTRQNGYDMAADALGYPESYYAPPMQAIERVEVVRGAASLQYGTQFGGMINLKLKEGDPHRKLSGQTVNAYNLIGSPKEGHGLFNTYNELGGQSGKLNYFAFVNFRSGDCNCDHSDFDAHTSYVKLRYQFTPRLKLSVEYTHMNYLAQQPGGLTDFEFEEDPYQSLRSRNWFKVKWNLAALTLDYDLSTKTTLNSRTFGLLSTRQALGFLSPPNRLDIAPYTDRDLIVDFYKNIGNETRLLHKYQIHDLPAALLVGIRFYSGHTEKKQGYGSNKTNADFNYNDSLRLKSDYQFPSSNFALFAENVFNITSKLSITPGIRYEYIRTTADGFYDSSVRIPNTGEIVVDSATYEQRQRLRSLLLGGLGAAYRINNSLEVYSNFSQNYRAITFNDMRVVSPSAAVDTNLQDEKGFNFDLGIRGNFGRAFTIDAGLFWLSYSNKIGSVQTIYEDEFFGERVVRLTTNVADADIIGIESYLETDILKLLGRKSKNFSWNHFINLALIHATYNHSAEKAIEGKQVEAVPAINLKSGVQGAYKNWKASLQFTYLSGQYSEATNAENSPSGIYGSIPSYWVLDLSLSYHLTHFSAEGGIQNLTNNAYYTRRAVGYPGPGIISSAPISFYLGVGYKF